MVEFTPIRPARSFCPALLLCLLPLAGCIGPPSLDEPQLVTAGSEQNPARAAAVQDMRARAAAGEFLDYPDVFADPAVPATEPLPVREVVAVQDRLVATARNRSAAYSPAEIAAGQARAAQLRRLAQARIAEAERAIQASGAR